MADNPAPGFGDLVGLFGTNPFANVTKSFQQFQRGVEQLMTTMDNLNATLEQLNAVSARVTRMLDLLEEPAKALIPQVTRTIKAADEMVDRMNAPLERIAPGLTRLAETLQNPALNSLPRDVNEFLTTLRDVGRRMQPLGQMAEAAGGMFRNSPFASFLPQTPRTESAPVPTTASVMPDVEVEEPPAPRPVKKAAAKKQAPAKKTAAKKTARTKSTAKKSTTNKTTTTRARRPAAG